MINVLASGGCQNHLRDTSVPFIAEWKPEIVQLEFSSRKRPVTAKDHQLMKTKRKQRTKPT